MTTLKRTLYQRLLGEKFAQLPEPMRTFHASPTGGRARGTLRVVRGSGLVAGLVARFAGLPPSAEKADVKLDVRVEGDCERWTRLFDKTKLATLQWERDGLLVEQFPGLRLGFELTIEGNTLVHRIRRSWLGNVPMPLALAPKIETTAQGTSLGWHLHVHVALPLLGRLIEYDGDVNCD